MKPKTKKKAGTADVKVSLSLQVPGVPNFVKVNNNGRYMGVETFSDKELRKIGREWTNKLVAHAQQRRKVNIIQK